MPCRLVLTSLCPCPPAYRPPPLQVPTRVFVTDALPKGPTGKIQRRFMADAFMGKDADKTSAGGGGLEIHDDEGIVGQVGLFRKFRGAVPRCVSGLAPVPDGIIRLCFLLQASKAGCGSALVAQRQSAQQTVRRFLHLFCLPISWLHARCSPGSAVILTGALRLPHPPPPALQAAGRQCQRQRRACCCRA